MKNIPAIAGTLSRRHFVLGAGATVTGACLPISLRAGSNAVVKTRQNAEILTGKRFELNISEQTVNFTGASRIATTVNQSLPAPTLRWKEGDRVTLAVTNNLQHDSSVHWHGLILPPDMDGVPGISFEGIKPGETFTYEFDVNQSGTYWYHSHSGFQEQTGLYGAIVIDPKDPDPVVYDRDYVVVLSDWSDEAPETIYGKLKKMSHYYNARERTLGDFAQEVKTKGFVTTLRDRAMWNQMRMSQHDISDVTGQTYTFLMNGNTPDTGWLGLYKPGEKVRLRFINAAAMTIFDVRIPGVKMTVVAADGQNIQPVSVDEFRIGTAETYDVIVEPAKAQACTLFAQAIDRSGYARGTLTTREDLLAEIPAMDPAPVLEHRDMGMDHSQHHMPGDGETDHSQHNMSGMQTMDHSRHGEKMDHGQHSQHGMSSTKAEDHSSHGGKTDHSQHKMSAGSGADHSGHNMSSMRSMDHSSHGKTDHSQHAKHAPASANLGKAGFGSRGDIIHQKTEFGPHVDMRASMPQSGLTDPGIGLREHKQKYGRRVLTYADIRNLTPTRDKRQPSREIQLHLTGNMSRYMWSVNGINHADAEPLKLQYGERVRILLVNDTMMTHPIHLHGMWSELETGDPDYIPRKHTILVQPGSTISYLVTADAKGGWAYHCHLLYHMPGMMREVQVG